MQKSHITHQGKASSSTLFIQPKLKIGSPNDRYEQEADRVADQVLSGSNNSVALNHGGSIIQKQCADCEEEELQLKPLSSQISPMIQPKGDHSNAGVPSSISNSIIASKGKGRSMDANTKQSMETSFGSDFSSVNIHTNSQAASLNQQLNARAFTVGNDIFFNKGEYQPNTSKGKHLLAHELTHTIQQSKGERVQRQHHSGASQHAQSIATMSESEKWSIVYDAGIQGLGNGVLWALNILLGFILILGIATMIIGLVCPPCIAAIESALATVIFGAAVSTWITAALGAIVAGSAMSRLVTEYQTVQAAVENATTVTELETAGNNWGRNSGEALVEIFTSLAALVPGIRAQLGSLFRGISRSRRAPTAAPAPTVPVANSATNRVMSLDEAIEVARRLRNNSEWLRELSRIKRIRDLAERNLAINEFIGNYGSATGIRIEVIPRHMAANHNLSSSNWGTFDEAANRIFVHEDIFTSSYADEVVEIAHEVGAAEIHRILGIEKANIPAITNGPPGIGYLTHVLDMFL